MAIENRFASENYVSEVLENYTKIDDLNDYAKLDALNDYATTEFVNSEIDRVLSLTERVKSWGAVQYYVRNGQAPYIFNIGDQLVCNHERYGELVWDIIGFDQDIPTDSQYTHSMTLQLHNILDTAERYFDAPEAYYRTTEELEAGNYYLILQTKLDGSGSNTHYQITIPSGTTIPANAILYGTVTACSFMSDDLSETYWSGKLTSKGSTTPTDGPILGIMNYYRANSSNGGSNNWNESGIRVFLNGENETLNWISQHDLDMPPPYINEPGFLYQIDPEFKEILGLVNKDNYNHITGEIEISSDLVFLPSKSEVYGGPIYNMSGTTLNVGEPYQYYVDNTSLSEPGTTTDTCKIKYGTNGTAYAYYLRNPYITNATTATAAANVTKLSAVSTTGAITGGNAAGTSSGARFLAPCCCIV